MDFKTNLNTKLHGYSHIFDSNLLCDRYPYIPKDNLLITNTKTTSS